MAGLLNNAMKSLSQVMTKLFGNSGIITVSNTSYNPLNGAHSEVDTTYTVYNAPPSSFESSELDATVLRGDLKVFISAQTTAGVDLPDLEQQKLRMTFTLDSVVYQIVTIKHVSAGSEPAGYNLQLRK